MPKSRKHTNEIHGAIDQDQPTNLEQIWGGYNELAKYGTLDEQEYTSQLDEMNRTDLEAHARKVGLVPIHDSARLKKNLIREFQTYAFYLRKPAKNKPAPKAPSKSVQSILNEGR